MKEDAARPWPLTDADPRHTTRVRAFPDFMAARIAADRDALEGRG